MKPLVYLETTIPSYYCDNRPAMAADIARTCEWWDGERGAYDCFISAAVLDELGNEDYPHKEASTSKCSERVKNGDWLRPSLEELCEF